MLILVETPVGYTLWRVTDDEILKSKDLLADYPNPSDVQSIVQLQSFVPFTNAEEAISSLEALKNSEVDTNLTQFINDNIISKSIQEEIQVAESGIARALDKLGVNCVAPPSKEIPEIFRLIKNNLISMLPGVDEETFRQLELGVAHGMSTNTLKFSSSKVDSMIVNSVHLLEELDKEVNNYGMRVREWYGWHFPELREFTSDNLQFSQIVLKMGRRENANITNFEELNFTPIKADEIRGKAQKSIGIDISDDDLHCIQSLATQVVELIEFKNQISNYIKERMKAIAPNTTELVGDLVGAKLIAHAGSLNQLAKQAGSTIQVFGAEKALFKAKKEDKKTPKYGLLYHAQIVAHADQKFKGRIARSLASKAALSVRYDNFADEPTNTLGLDDSERLENRLRQYEGQNVTFEKSRSAIKEEPQKVVVAQVPNYKADADFQIEEQPKKRKKRRHHHTEEGAEGENAEQVVENTEQ